MFIVFGSGSKMDDCGTAENYRCPGCGTIVDMNIIRRYSYFSVFFIPLIRFGTRYFTSCPRCGSTTEISKEDGKQFLKTGKLENKNPSPATATLEQLAPPGNPSRQTQTIYYCGQCGKKLTPGDNFCSNCGNRVPSGEIDILS